MPIPVSIRSIPSSVPLDVANVLKDIRTSVLTLTQGSLNNRALTRSDLVDSGLARWARKSTAYNPGNSLGADAQIEPVSGPLVTAKPTEIFDFRGTEFIGGVALTWRPLAYVGHSYVELWRSSTPSKAEAEIIANIPAGVNSYNDSVAKIGKLYYWAFAVSTGGTHGPMATVTVKPLINPEYVLNKLQSAVTESELYDVLNTRIDNIDNLGGTGVGLLDSYVVKLDVNGHIAGFGVAISGGVPGPLFSQFIIRANQFAITFPGTTWYTPWTPAVDEYCLPSVSNDRQFRCSTSGAVGGTEPSWDLTIGNTTNDGAAVWTTEALSTGDIPFIVGQVGGVTKVGIDGDLVVDGTIIADALNVAELSAITANLGTITAGQIASPLFYSSGSHCPSSTGAAATTVTVFDASGFSTSGSGYFTDSTNDNNAFSWTGKSGNDLTGCTGVLAHNAGAVVTEAQNIVTFGDNNEMYFYGDRGDGTVERLVSIGITQDGSDYIVGDFGSLNSGNARLGVRGRSYSYYGVYGRSEDGTGVYGRTNQNSGGGAYGVQGIGDGANVLNVGVFGSSDSGYGGRFHADTSGAKASMRLSSVLSGAPTGAALAGSLIVPSGGTEAGQLFYNRDGSANWVRLDNTYAWAFAFAAFVGGVGPTLQKSHNFSSITRVSAGVYRLFFTNNAASSTYVAVVSHDSAGSLLEIISARTATYVEVQFNADPIYGHVIVFGGE